jgi:hypothetical protein
MVRPESCLAGIVAGEETKGGLFALVAGGAEADALGAEGGLLDLTPGAAEEDTASTEGEALVLAVNVKGKVAGIGDDFVTAAAAPGVSGVEVDGAGAGVGDTTVVVRAAAVVEGVTRGAVEAAGAPACLPGG